MNEEGIDVYETKARIKAENDAFLAAFNRYRHKFSDEFQQQVWQEYQRSIGILPPEEQQAKDEFSLQKARTAKDELRLAGMSDAPRFGTCKRIGCKNRKFDRLLLRGFCHECRGVTVKQTIASGGSIFTGAFDATNGQGATTLTVHKTKAKIHPDALELTSEDRRTKVLSAKEQNPSASTREIAELTKVPRETVRRILRNPIVKAQSENADEVKQFLETRAKKPQKELAEQSSIYKTTTRQKNPEGREQLYALAEMGHFSPLKRAEMGQLPCAAVNACPELA